MNNYIYSIWLNFLDIPTDKKAVTKATLLLGAGLGAVIYGLLWLIELL